MRATGATMPRTPIGRWGIGAGAGEKLHIFPYQENADAMFNFRAGLRALGAASAGGAAPPAGGLRHSGVCRGPASAGVHDWFLPIEPSGLPDNSILREFVGGSILKDFKIWGVG